MDMHNVILGIHSNIHFEKQIESVQKTLDEINCLDKEQIIVYNKVKATYFHFV